MKIRVTETIAVDVKVQQTATTPSGNTYWNIDYLIDGICIHNATTGPITGSPNPITMLDRTFPVVITRYQDVTNPEPKPDSITDGKLYSGSSSGRPAWWIERQKTHRQAIIDAVSQIVVN